MTNETAAPALDLWERVRRSEKGLRLRFPTKAQAFRAQMRLYSYRASARKRNAGISLYDNYSIQMREVQADPSAPPLSRTIAPTEWHLLIYPAGSDFPFTIDARIEEL